MLLYSTCSLTVHVIYCLHIPDTNKQVIPDLWGRGYSDTPFNIPHDSRLYGQQILHAISSSPVQWSGFKKDHSSNPASSTRIRFSIVGFSMGSAVVLDFFAHQPHLVNSVVLMAPAGLVRTMPPEYKSLLSKYPGLTSRKTFRALVGRVFGVDLTPVPTGDLRVSATDESEVAGGFTPARVLQFQFDHHQGLIDSFLSTIRHGPYQGQEAVWERAAQLIKGEVAADNPVTGNDVLTDTSLRHGKFLVLCGEDDNLVPAADVEEDLAKYFGCSEDDDTEKKFYELKVVPGTHDFPWSEGERVGRILTEFWGL